MSDRPSARATIVIERMPDVVRAQFFDVDHHVRDRLHHGVKLSFAPPSLSGAKPAKTEPPPASSSSARVRQETRVFGRSLVEEFVLEEDAAKRWVKRFVDGPNAGAKYVASFALQEGKATRIDLEAFAPASGFDNGLGKLSQLGVEKALQKLLQEHKAALEHPGGGYEPGKARGDVEVVLKALRDLTSPLLQKTKDEQRAIVSNFMELASLVAIADDDVDDAERQTMKGTARALCFVELDDATLDKLVASTRGAVEKEGADGRADKIGSRLKRLGVEQLGLAVAALIAQVSHGIDARELAILQRVAQAATVTDTDLAKLVARIDKMLSGPVDA